MRVLYVGYILLADNNATGKTLNSIFKNSNIEVLQCCTDYDCSRHSTEWPSVYISKRRSILYYMIKSIYRCIFERSRKFKANVIGVVSGHDKNVFVSFAQGILDISHKSVSTETLRVLDEYRPDIIYTLAENISVLKISKLFSERYNAPIVCHIMDDIESSIYSEGLLTLPLRKKYLNLSQSIYSRFKWHLTISEKMAKEYTHRHNCSYGFAMNCIFKVYPSPQPKNTPIKIVFSGGLHGGRNASLLKIAKVINNDKFLREHISLQIYTSMNNIQSNLDLVQVCHVNEYVPEDKIIENLASADILLHVESFEKEEIEYFRYSMSTKLPEYMSVGRPILCYGPMSINTVSFIRTHNVGLVAENIEELISSLYMLMDESIREQYAKTAVSVAKSYFLSESIHKNIYTVFENAMRNK